MYKLINELTESKLFPTRKSLEKYKIQEISEIAYLYILALYILYSDPNTKKYAINYCNKTTSYNTFSKWKTDINDLYVLLHQLYTEEKVSIYAVNDWLKSIAHTTLNEKDTKSFFVKLDSIFAIKNSSMSAVRRSIQNWTSISRKEQKQSVTQLLMFLNLHAKSGDIIHELSRFANKHNLEVKKSSNFLSTLTNIEAGGIIFTKANEAATGGASCAAGVAAVPGGGKNTYGTIGAGFDNDYTKSIYPAPKHKTQKKPSVVSRLVEAKNKIYYHITYAKDVPSIMAKGLEPRIGSLSLLAGENKPRVYLFKHLSDAEDALMNWLGEHLLDTEDLALLQIDLPNSIKVKPSALQGDMGYEFTVDSLIPPQCLKVLTLDTDSFDFN